MTQSNESPFVPSFDALVDKKLQEAHVPGLSIAVIRDDKVHAKGYGIASFPSERVTPETLFYTGSTTKAFLGAAWAQVIESEDNQKKTPAERLAFDTPLVTLIRDDFVLQDDYATNHITIEDALSHRTGMTRHDMSYGGPVNTVKKIVRSMRNFPLAYKLRTTWYYCNIMYVAASHALETATGQQLGKTFKEKIWDPLGMKNTYSNLPDVENAVASREVKMARGYLWHEGKDEAKGTFEPYEHMNLSHISGAGYIISNVLDYAEWIRAVINQSAPLSEKIVSAMTASRAIVEMKCEPYDGVATYALGWDVNTYKGEQVISHAGGLIGFGATVLILPKRKWGIVSFGNTSMTSNAVEESLAFHLVDELLGISGGKTEEAENGTQAQGKKAPVDKGANDGANLYQSAPKPAMAPALPLKAYAGTYSQPGYRSFTFTLQKQKDKDSKNTEVLFADAKDRTWPFTITLKHITGEYWTAALIGRFEPDVQRAEFRLGEDGKVNELGIAMDRATPEHLFWFKKVDV